MIKATAIESNDLTAICAIDDRETVEALSAMITKPAFAGLVMKKDDAAIGFIYGWVFDAQGEVVQGEVVQLTVAPAYRRQGFGQCLTAQFLADFYLTSCWLELRADNQPALELYRRIGFVEDGVRKGYYRTDAITPNATDAILMHWKT